MLAFKIALISSFAIVISIHTLGASGYGDDEYFEIMERIRQMNARIAEKNRIEREKRENLQFQDEEVFNRSRPGDIFSGLNYRERKLPFFQLVGK